MTVFTQSTRNSHTDAESITQMAPQPYINQKYRKKPDINHTGVLIEKFFAISPYRNFKVSKVLMSGFYVSENVL